MIVYVFREYRDNQLPSWGYCRDDQLGQMWVWHNGDPYNRRETRQYSHESMLKLGYRVVDYVLNRIDEGF